MNMEQIKEFDKWIDSKIPLIKEIGHYYFGDHGYRYDGIDDEGSIRLISRSYGEDNYDYFPLEWIADDCDWKAIIIKQRAFQEAINKERLRKELEEKAKKEAEALIRKEKKDQEEYERLKKKFEGEKC